ncbi:hypothetical protein CEQ90_13755 [Lewinellaceae bacterium SD302]|nr:hypothetical protein CEQ90_13755 [Lewinellaceae bacterium SD302]
MLKQLLFLPSFIFFLFQLQAQAGDYWSNINEADISPAGERLILPTKSSAFSLDTDRLQDILASAPLESSYPSIDERAILSVPLPNGQTTEFRIVRYELMEAGIQAKHPTLRAYYGRGVDDPGQRIRLDWTLAGFRAVLTLPEGTAFIDPYAKGDTEHYLSYYKSDYPAPADTYECGVKAGGDQKLNIGLNGLAKAGDCQFRSYRIAIACAAEYSNYHGATSAAQSGLVLSEVMTSVNRLNDVYEIDFTIRLILVDEADEVFYYNPATDPYTNGNPGEMIDEVGPDLNANIGSANYDIGHVYGTNSGGLAGLRVVCGGGKASGVTGSGNPTNDPFWIDYVAHEVGHQFGGNHTQNNSCNRSSASFEPGSASTIMGYAGICNPNVQSNSDAYFHAISQAEVSNFVVNGNGGGCATIIANPNNAPAVDAGVDYFIPISTPYVLTATGTDQDGDDVLTYCWEQYNNEVAEIMPPDPTNLQGPMFRSLLPNTSNQRFFPNLATVVANGIDPWERLSSVSRELDFRVTVRDNSLNTASCTDEDDMLITVTSAAGPFLVNAPNEPDQIWYEGETKTIIWDVANTDQEPVNCANVDVLLSYDGGFTYPVTLATNVANNGAIPITVPTLQAGAITTARVMVRCANNVFYDISNNDFSILPVEDNYSFEVVPVSIDVCQGDTAVFTINTNAIGNFDGLVALNWTAYENGNPNTIYFDENNPPAGTSSTITVTTADTTSPGDYPIIVYASNYFNSDFLQLPILVTVFPSNETVGLVSPTDGALDVSTSPVLNWSMISGVTHYQLQLATDAAFNQIVIDTNLIVTNFQPAVSLDLATSYYWRVRALLPCDGPFATARSFTTGTCLGLTNNTPLDISPNGQGIVYNSIVSTTRSEVVESVVVSNMSGTHTWMEDLDVHLISPLGTRVELFSDRCGNSDNFNIGFDDNAPESVLDAPCVPLGQGFTYQPIDDLADFIGETVTGDWTLEIVDDANQDGGQLQSWSVEICLTFDPLPVEWLGFSATARTKDIRLDWSTASEKDNDAFEIERMAAGESEFSKIGQQASTRGAEFGSNYQFIDEDVRPGLEYFYRIRQVDTDGSSSLSPVQSAKIRRNGNGYTLYPNPVTERLSILASEASETVIGYQLYDATGRLVAQQKTSFDLANGIDCSSLVSGVYSVRLLSVNGTLESRRFVVKR